ncbi:Alpha/Beta hydrolase protein [Lasiosphaeria miniovina]|uniref:Alpha/Beta hydrolase protein n=1 Tax=Lasiosphaeria miniovina TaxID=1954250 RepID=A0AA40B4V7_9PEZI|nr:Alpha/Beta hydrolase protein [Lasiosphaeria miniovina]KAK0727633.1 Alpha/Beta hydrolase protein [Lasiosphaeria miniovina]
MTPRQLYVFKNIRFGAKPVRFAAPRYPTNLDSSIQDPTYGPACYQIQPKALSNPPGGSHSIKAPRNGLEQPNPGLYDQALLLDWVQKYVGQAGGDASQVSAWGESASAGSILHHLVREGGTVNPGFKTFLAQSPAFEWSWDNSSDGTLDTIYRDFSGHAKCGFRYEIECLRGARVEDLASANQKLFDVVHQTGLFPVGPSVDGRYRCGITRALISHVSDETASFTPAYVVSGNPSTASTGSIH